MKLLRYIDRNLHQLITTFNNFTNFVMSDEIFLNHQNYCVHVKLYLTLRHVIKYADIDLFRYSLRKIAVAFQFEAIESSKYVKTFLRLFHVIDSPTAFVKL